MSKWDKIAVLLRVQGPCKNVGVLNHQHQHILPTNSRHSLILAHPLPWPLGKGAQPTWQGAPPASQLFSSLPLTASSSWLELAAGGFVQQQKEQVNGRQAEVGSCTAGREAEAVYTSSPPLLQPPPVKSDQAALQRDEGTKPPTAGKLWQKLFFTEAIANAKAHNFSKIFQCDCNSKDHTSR